MNRLCPLPALLPGLLVGVLLLGGCGDDVDPGPTPATPTSDAPSGAPSDAPSGAPSDDAAPDPGSTPATPGSTGGVGTASPTTAPDGSAPPSAGGGTVDLSVPPRTYAEALAHAEALSTTPRRLDRFQTRDGTYCVLSSEYLPFSCELERGGVPAPDVCGDGPAGNVGRIEVEDGRPVPVCNTDTVREPGAPRLKVGEAARDDHGAGCWIESFGVTCVDTVTERGFFLAPGRYEVLGG